MEISIIIPVHNSEKYLEECIKSIFIQERSDYEIILVENGSTDHTPEICKNYSEKFGCIKYIQLGNVGVSIARNKGIRAATGNFITFLDSDDCLLPGALESVLTCVENSTEILLTGYSNTMMCEERITNKKKISSDLLARGVLQFAKYQKKISKDAAIDTYNNWTCWSKYFRRSFLIENNIEFPPGVRLGEDAAFCFQAYCAADNILAIKQKTYYYRTNQESVSRQFDFGLAENNQNLIMCFERYGNYWKKKRIYEKEFASFYVGKVIELCRNCFSNSQYPDPIKKSAEWLKELCTNTEIKNAIIGVKYSKLIPGKRNSISYMITLFFLKKKMYQAAIRINRY